MKPEVKVWPSAVRKAVLAEHKHIAATLVEVEKLAGRCIDGDKAATSELRTLVASFLRYFENHLRFEEKMLVPVLEDDYAWGRERIEHLHADHLKQRAELADIGQKAGDPKFDPRALGEMIHELVLELTDDMASEERDLLTEEILHDYPDTPDQNSG